MCSLHDFVLDEELDVLEMMMVKIENVETKIEGLVGEDDDVKLSLTVPGIGLLTASVIEAEMGDLASFSSSEDLVAYVGLTPITYRSEEKTWSGHARNDHSRIKHVLIEATLFHFRRCPDPGISLYYARKKDSIGKKKVVVAGGRMLTEVIYFMLLRQEEFHAH